MFKHAHADDPVKTLIEIAVVNQTEGDLVAEPGFFCTCFGRCELIFAESDASYLRAIVARECHCHTAPPAADVQD